jgi:hypothetical protein
MQYNVVKLFKKTCCFIFEGKISLLSSMSECCYSQNPEVNAFGK